MCDHDVVMILALFALNRSQKDDLRYMGTG